MTKAAPLRAKPKAAGTLRRPHPLYLITDRKATAGRPLEDVVASALEGGLKALQLREKDFLPEQDLLELARRLRRLTEKYSAQLYINDSCDIALAVGADGVHLAQNSITPEAVRDICGDRLIIGASTHSVQEAIEAERLGADFITLGPVYMTPSKLKYGPPLGLKTLSEATGKVAIPVFAIGGVKPEAAKEVLEAGAYGIALISAVMEAEDVRKETKALIEKITS